MHIIVNVTISYKITLSLISQLSIIPIKISLKMEACKVKSYICDFYTIVL